MPSQHIRSRYWSYRPPGAAASNWQTVIYFCPFCQVSVHRAHELEEQHMLAHVTAGEATTTIAQYGIMGHTKQGLWTHPGFCIFCLYDTKMSVFRRFKVHSTVDALLEHIADHVLEASTEMCCPAAVATTPEGLPRCSETALFDATEMGKHLQEVHEIRHNAVVVDSRPDACPHQDLEPAQPGDKRKDNREVTRKDG